MSNQYFSFKQFTVHQGSAAMKVCTDACLFGAYVAAMLQHDIGVKQILDIGTGTGLLSLMVAQKTGARIHAVEIDPSAALQAGQNVRLSPWASRITVEQTAIQDYCPDVRFDFIISNPPFYTNDLTSADQQRNLALHGTGLQPEELFRAISQQLKPGGRFALLLPFHRSTYFQQLATDAGYWLHQQVLVRQTEKHPFFRSMLVFGDHQQQVRQKEVIIRQEGEYSAAFISLLQDYYLYL